MTVDMTGRRTIFAASLGLACAAGAWLLATHDAPKATRATQTASLEALAPSAQQVSPVPVASTPSPSASTPTAPAAPAADEPAVAMRDVLTWQDDAARIDAIEAAIDAGAVKVLPVLEHVVLADDPEAAPTVIHAVAALGARAGGADAREAGQTLARWLHDESRRQGADALGNTSVLVDALGELGGSASSEALAAALDDGTLPLAVQTLAVQRITQLGGAHNATEQAAIARFAARVAAMPPANEGDEIDETLREEALALVSSTSDHP
jgi:hypothetical protein